MRLISKSLLAASTLLLVGLTLAHANPTGSSVVAGAAAVSGQGTETLTVTQSTDKAIINWQTFNIGNGETTQFVQPSSSSVTLNRVTGGLGPSDIEGALKANGNVFVINPDGILFGPNSVVDVGSLVATTSDIADADFMAGTYAFTKPGNPTASVVNAGTITAANGGFAALVAPGVRNSGTITATLGTVDLASADQFTLDFYGDQLLTLSVADQTAAAVIDVQTGQPLDALVKNNGKLSANGGTVELTAASARAVVDSVINNTGVIEANSVGTKNGEIVLSAATASIKTAGAPVQKVKVSGPISAAGRSKGQTGGKVEITGEAIELASANIDASGAAGGGTILIGGDVGGGSPSAIAASIPKAALESVPVPNATTTTIDVSTVINASATDNGDGGKVVLWADGITDAYGTVSVDGGANGGDGGFAEISGAQGLDYSGLVLNVAAPEGVAGTGLFDPYVPAPITTANVSTITSMLNEGGTAVVYGSSVAVHTSIIKTAGGTATLKIFGDDGITIDSDITIGATTGSLNLVLDADADVNSHFNYPGMVNPPQVVSFADPSYPGTSTTSEQADTFFSFVGARDAAYFNYISGGMVSLPSIVSTSLTGQNLYTALGSYIPSGEQSQVNASVITWGTGDKIYTNGGSLNAYGNQYQITNDQHFFGSTTVANLSSYISGLAASAGSNLPIFYVVEVGSTAYVYESLENFARIPAGIPGGTIQFGSVVNSVSQSPLTAVAAGVCDVNMSCLSSLSPVAAVKTISLPAFESIVETGFGKFESLLSVDLVTGFQTDLNKKIVEILGNNTHLSISDGSFTVLGAALSAVGSYYIQLETDRINAAQGPIAAGTADYAMKVALNAAIDYLTTPPLWDTGWIGAGGALGAGIVQSTVGNLVDVVVTLSGY